MSRKLINIGTEANDGTGTPLRTSFSNLNDMSAELYETKQLMHDLAALTVSDTDDLYAHESQILIQQLGNKTVLLVIYTSDKVSSVERELTAHAMLKVYELTTKTHLKTIDLFTPGLVAGLTMEADETITAPRMYVTGDTLMCFCGNESKLYHRTIDISNDDPSTWTASNLSVFQMTMKDSGGSSVKVDVTSANVQAHLENTLGDTYAGYQNLAPWFRNLDRIAKSGSDWYSILELSDELGAGLSNIAMLVKSTDSGLNWSFVNVIAYSTSSRRRVLEASAVFIGSRLHVVHRMSTNYIGHVYSDNNGTSWTVGIDIPALASKPTAINYYKHDGTVGALIAFNLASEITGNTYRTTLAIYSTSDFVSLTEIAKIVTGSYAHYPSMCHFSRGLYISYSKGLKYNTDGIANTLHNRNTIVVAKIY